MRARGRRALVMLGALAAATTGCVRSYRQPSPDQPHANVQFRLVHHAEPSEAFDEVLRIDGRAVALSRESEGVRTATVRVRPQTTEYDVHTEFFHEVTRWEPQTYWQSQGYVCGTNRYGPYYCTSQWPQTTIVPVTTRVEDGSCNAHFEQRPLPGAVYLVQYEYLTHGVCRMTCQRLLEGPNGSVLATACGADEPATWESVPRGTTGGEVAPSAR